MTRKRIRNDFRHSAPDHRPMIPEFRQPEDALDTVIREARRRLDELTPDRKMNWR